MNKFKDSKLRIFTSFVFVIFTQQMVDRKLDGDKKALVPGGGGDFTLITTILKR